jgi:hypothetical protein
VALFGTSLPFMRFDLSMFGFGDFGWLKPIWGNTAKQITANI